MQKTKMAVRLGTVHTHTCNLKNIKIRKIRQIDLQKYRSICLVFDAK